MTGEFKAVILDLDETMVRSRADALPSAAVAEAIRAAHSEHVSVHVATGRPFRAAKHVLKAANIDDWCVVNGGSEIYSPKKGEPIFSTAMSDHAQAAVIELFHKRRIPLYDNAGQYGGGPPVQPDALVDSNNSKFFVQAISPALAAELIEEIDDIGELAVYRASSWLPGEVVDLHITDITATKQGGVETLMDMKNLLPAEVIAVGDSPIDLPMFKSVGFSVAMGNAGEEVKAAADVIAPSVEDDGVAWVFNNFVLKNAEVRVFPVTH